MVWAVIAPCAYGVDLSVEPTAPARGATVEVRFAVEGRIDDVLEIWQTPEVRYRMRLSKSTSSPAAYSVRVPVFSKRPLTLRMNGKEFLARPVGDISPPVDGGVYAFLGKPAISRRMWYPLAVFFVLYLAVLATLRRIPAGKQRYAAAVGVVVLFSLLAAAETTQGVTLNRKDVFVVGEKSTHRWRILLLESTFGGSVDLVSRNGLLQPVVPPGFDRVVTVELEGRGSRIHGLSLPPWSRFVTTVLEVGTSVVPPVRLSGRVVESTASFPLMVFTRRAGEWVCVETLAGRGMRVSIDALDVGKSRKGGKKVLDPLERYLARRVISLFPSVRAAFIGGDTLVFVEGRK